MARLTFFLLVVCCFFFVLVVSFVFFSSWWFQTFFMFTLTWGDDPIWLIFFKWVETTNQFCWFCYGLLLIPNLWTSGKLPDFQGSFCGRSDSAGRRGLPTMGSYKGGPLTNYSWGDTVDGKNPGPVDMVNIHNIPIIYKVLYIPGGDRRISSIHSNSYK